MSAHCVQAFCYEIKREEKIREERSLGCFEGFSMIISIAERKKQSLVRARSDITRSIRTSQTYRPAFPSPPFGTIQFS